MRARWFLAAVATFGLVRAAHAQQPDVRRAQATRAELEALASKGSPADAAAIQQRLRDGDFQPGDRIVLRVLDEPTLTDSFTVQPARTLRLPNFPEISVAGVLRSELETYLTQKIAERIRDPQVRAVSLIRIAVLGAVARPGYYNLPAETVLSDAVMAAGGPSTQADTRKARVVRNGVDVLDRAATQTALAQGATLDQLSLHGGDQIMVGEKGSGAKGTLQTLGLVSGIIVSAVAVATLF